MSVDDEVALVKCGTTKGPFTIRFIKRWSPLGYDRAVELFERGFYDHTHLFRVIPGFLVQFGITYTDDHELKKFAKKTIPDDPKLDELRAFRPGLVSYAGSGGDSRDSQLFISYGSAKSLGTMPWETPLGEVIEGLDGTVRKFNSEYRDTPKQGKIHAGPKYIEENFPNMDKFITCSVERMIQSDAAKEEEEVAPVEVEEQPAAAAVGDPASLNDEKEIKGVTEGKSERLRAASARLGSTVRSQSAGENLPIIFGGVALLGVFFVAKRRISGRGRPKSL